MTTYWLLGEKTPTEDLGQLLATAATATAAASAVPPSVNSIGSFPKLHAANNVGSGSAAKSVTAANNMANHNNITASTPLLQGDSG